MASSRAGKIENLIFGLQPLRASVCKFPQRLKPDNV